MCGIVDLELVNMNRKIKELIFESFENLDHWLSENDFKAYDPFDGLNSKILNRLTFDNHYLRIILQQTVRRFPINIRPYLGIRKEASSKGMAFCASGYLKMFQATGERVYREKAESCLDWLEKNYCNGYSGYAWGNHFSYESRGGKIPLNVPTIVWTSLITNVFFDAYELLGEPRYFDVAKSACNFIINDIGRFEDTDGSLCLMYTPLNRNNPSLEACVHNSNVLGAWVLGRIYKHTGRDEYLSIAEKAMEFTAKHQSPDGSWYYGVANKFRWVDSFHTGYVLESLDGYSKATGDRSYEEKLFRGYCYFLSKFFKEDGTPRYYNHKTYPIDIQCASQGIQTLVNLRGLDDSSLDIAKRVAVWTVRNMQDKRGFFYFRKYPLIINKTPMFHWGQATMISALTSLHKEL
jgi:rhamnogalacturonyl hydrolase YesR